MLTQALSIFLAGSFGGATSDAGCPARDAVTAELQRLGAASAVAAVGSPEVAVQGTRMHVALRGLDGAVSGTREVAAPASCGERARVAAVLIAAWVGKWSAGSSSDAAQTAREAAHAPEGDFTPTEKVVTPVGRPTVENVTIRPPDTAPSPPALSPKPAAVIDAAGAGRSPAKVANDSAANAPIRPGRRHWVEVGGFGFGIHDGSAGTFGGGAQAGLRFSRWLGIDAVFEGSGERERALPTGSSAYRLLDLGLGIDVRKDLRAMFVDLGVLPEATLLTVDGRNLSLGKSVTRWGLSIEARLRFGLAFGAWRPFAFAGTSCALRAERLTLDDQPGQGTTLSRWNASIGLGLAYLWGAAQ